jgi:amino acid adenylation domain-containing protein
MNMPEATATIHGLFRGTAIERGANIAVSEPGKDVSYRQLLERSDAVADYLFAHGIRTGEAVGIFLPPGADFIAALLGISSAGGVFMPIDQGWPRHRIATVLEQRRPRFVFSSANSAALPDDTQQKATSVGASVLADGVLNYRVACSPVDDYGGALATEDACYIYFTSGSTGVPKGVLGLHRSIVHFIRWEIDFLASTSTTRAAHLAPTSFDASLRDIFVPLVSGGTVCLPDTETKTNPTLLLHWLRDARINLLHLVPSLLRALVEEAEDNEVVRGCLRNLDAVMLAGEPLFGRDVNRLGHLASPRTRICNLYGPTETTLIKLVYEIPPRKRPWADGDMVPLGEPMAGASVSVLVDGREAEIEEVGEIVIETPFATAGYVDDPELTAARYKSLFNGHLGTVTQYHTGDLGRRCTDGRLLFEGRIDDQVKLNGNRVELGAIETTVRAVPGIIDAAAVLRTGRGQSAIFCFYRSKTEVPETLLRAEVRASLPTYFCPSRFIRVERFPLRLNNKIDKARLADLISEQPARVAGHQSAVMDTLLKTIGQIFPSLITEPATSFVDLGGTSLDAMRLIARIYKEFGCKLQMKDVFEHRSFAELATHIEQAVGSVPQAPLTERSIAPAAAMAHFPLSPYQAGMWRLRQFRGSRIAYNQIICYEIAGDLDVNLCGQVLEQLVARFEILRTRYEEVAGEPRQFVEPYRPGLLGLALADLRKASDQQAALRASLQREQEREWDFAAAAPLWVCLYQLEDRRYVLTYVFYHIIGDMWSIALLRRTAAALYQDMRDERTWPPGPALQFKDVCVWQRSEVESLRGGIQERFWRETLSSPPPALNLAPRRPPVRTFRGATHEFKIDPASVTVLDMIRKRSGTSPFLLGLASFARLLQRETGQREMIIGTPVSMRDRIDMEGQLGMFLNMLPILLRLPSDGSCAADVAEVIRAVDAAFSHKTLPFDALVAQAGVGIPLNRSPLFDVVFTYVEAAESHLASFSAGDFQVASFTFWPATSKYDLSVTLLDTGDVWLEYNSDIIGASRAVELGECFCATLVDFARQSSCKGNEKTNDGAVMAGSTRTR